MSEREHNELANVQRERALGKEGKYTIATREQKWSVDRDYYEMIHGVAIEWAKEKTSCRGTNDCLSCGKRWMNPEMSNTEQVPIHAADCKAARILNLKREK